MTPTSNSEARKAHEPRRDTILAEIPVDEARRAIAWVEDLLMADPLADAAALVTVAHAISNALDARIPSEVSR